jgi:hypothetical protein
MIELDTTPDYPPSPDYYEAPDLIKVDGQRVRLNVHHVIDAWQLDYWLGSAVAHILRAGRKPGETERAAISNAWGTLIGWFRCAEWSLPVGRLETDALRAENARLRAELAALRTPLESDAPTTVNSYTGDTSVASCPCPVAAALRPTNIKGEWTPRPVEPATSVNEWTDDELAEWLDANRCPHRITPHGVRIWDFQPCEYAYGMTLGDNGWHGLAIDHLGHPDGKSATEAARILNATKPPADLFAGLLSVETDHDLLDWFDGPHAESTPKAVYVGAIDIGGDLVPAGWYVRGHDDGDRMTAREAARTLHRILTGGAA